MAEHRAWSTRGVKTLVSGVVALLWYSHKQTGGSATALVWAGIIVLREDLPETITRIQAVDRDLAAVGVLRPVALAWAERSG
jgi:hypothetical protein